MYIGKQPQIGNYQVCDAISASATATYALTVSSVAVFPESANHVICSLNGVIQKPGSSFSISSSNIVFSSALTSSDSIDFIILLGSTLDVGIVSDGTITNAKLAQDIISGETELASAPADTDEFLVSDAGTLKRIDYSLIKGISAITPFFGATQSGTVTGIGDGVISKITCDTEVFDSNGAYDPSTNYRFTIPTGEGGTYLFFFAAKIRSDTLHQLRAADILLRKNGSTICSNNSNYNQNLALQYHAATFWMDTGSAGDYYEIFFQPSVDSGTGKGNNGRFFGYKID